MAKAMTAKPEARCLIANMKKNKKFQKEQLMEDGYSEIVDCYCDSVDQL